MNTHGHDLGGAQFDLLVVGAGINGAALARDAAMRGLRVLLVDKGDVGGGTTSWSTRLIHGGLRYLEHFAVPLVRESLHERNVLLGTTAPHLVRPLHFLIPVYAAGSRSARTIRLGMVAYEVLSLGKQVEHHRMLTPQETLDHAPGLDPEGLRGAALYYDAQAMYPERLALENALSAQEHGASVLTYTQVEAFEVADGQVRAAQVRDARSGRRWVVRAAVVVNAAGPWADEVARALPGERRRLIGGTKGSHLVVAPFPGAPSTALYTEATDNRPYFIVPWAGNYLVGTTDERFDGDPDDVAASDEEIDYLIESTNEVVPGAQLDRNAVLWTYAGVRPLPYEPDVPESRVTRKHVFYHDQQVRNVISVVGGKLTTHRALAEQGINRVFDTLGRKTPPCRTAHEPLPGGRTGDVDWGHFAASFRDSSAVPADIAEHLLEVYGARAGEVVHYASADELLRTRLPGTTTLAAEVPFAVQRESASTLSDVYLRRTMLGVRGDLGLGTLRTAAEVARARLGWSERRAGEEIAEYHRFLARYHRGRVPSGEVS